MQSINLYLPEFRPKFNPLAAGFLLPLAAGFLLILVLIQTQLWLEKKTFSEKLIVIKQDIANTEQQLDALKKVPKGMDKASVEAAIATAQEAIRHREYALGRLNNNNLGNDKGFSVALLALSRHSLVDVVLTEFAFFQGGLQVELRGLTKRNAAVPEYVHQLQTDVFFKNSDFGSLTLKKSQKTGVMEFKYARPIKDQAEEPPFSPSVQALLKGF